MRIEGIQMKKGGIQMKIEGIQTKTERPALMTHVYYGDPTEDFSLKLIKALVDGGADIIEFGIPFSDPTSDGPVFQAACARAIKNGILPSKCIDGIRKVRDLGIKVPIIVTTYYNIIYSMGVEKFVKAIGEAGAQGVIVPDVPFEEIQPLLDAGKNYGIDVIQLVTVATNDKRLRNIAKHAQGFLYVVSRPGVTGVQEDIHESTASLIQRIKKFTDVPLLVGFGISKPEHATSVIEAGADGVIVGSAIGKMYESHLPDAEKALPEVQTFVAEMKSACRQGLLRRNYKSKEEEE